MADALGTLQGKVRTGNQSGTTSGAAAGDTVSSVYQSVYSPTQADAFIRQQIQAILKRPATDADIKYWAPKLMAAQKANPSRQVVTTDNVTGNTVQQTVGGLNEADWFASKLKTNKAYKAEYTTVQQNLDNANVAKLRQTAYANGITISDDQLMNWSKQIAGGQDITNYENIIRQQAALGQPDSVKNLLGQGVDLGTVYSPYKSVMARVLELNPDAISIDDPVLRSAIKPDGEVSIYDFQRQLRQDPRWQYTDNARAEVSNVAQRVLKDFGFMG